MLEIVEYQNLAQGAWNRFVEECESSSFFHLAEWYDVIAKYFKGEPFWLAAREDNKIVGILPLFLCKNIFGKNCLVPVPFSGYAGICATDNRAIRMLMKAAEEIAHKVSAHYIEFRQISELRTSLPVNTEHYLHILELAPDPAIVWKSKFEASVRNQTRKAQKMGLVTFWGTKYLRDFYKIYVHNMHALGSPAFGYSLFQGISKEFSDRMEVIVVAYQSRIIGGLILFKFKDRVTNVWGSSLRNFWEFCPNNLLYWEAIKFSCTEGYRFFNFGRSQVGSSTFKFKKQWGASAKQLFYYYHLNKAKEIPSVNKSKVKYFFVMNMWQKLPVGLTSIIGPMISKHILL